MTFRTCLYEKELRQALKDGHWPAGCLPELRDHVQACASCSDLVLVTEAFQQARKSSALEVPQTSNLLWWRAQLQRRRTAAEQVGRPITVAQTFAWAVSVLAAVMFAISQYHHGLRWANWWSEVAPLRLFQQAPLATRSLDWNLFLLIPTIAAVALVGGVVVYLVSEKP
jgi:hypothetical protein